MNESTTAVFLSASFPQPGRADRFPASDPADLTDAVSFISRQLLRRNVTIVCGGHPTITPLLLFLAAEEDVRDRIVVFQSDYFRKLIPRETIRLQQEGWGRLEFVESQTPHRDGGLRSVFLNLLDRAAPATRGNPGHTTPGWLEGLARRIRQRGRTAREADLLTMRRRMLTYTPLRAGIFIGGMEGIVDEFELMGELSPRTPRFPLSSPGGAAATLPTDISTEIVDTGSRRYPVLALELTRFLDLEPRGRS